MSEPELKKNNGKKIVFAVIAGIILLGSGTDECLYSQTPPESVKQKSLKKSNLSEQYTVQLPNGVKLEMVKVEAGTFTMSKRDGENCDNEVEHTVTLRKDFYIGKTEVTQAQWKAVMGNNPSKFKGDNLPVEWVSWHDAMKFCKKLNELTEGKRPTGYHYTLPTETQWEYACRGGKRSKGYKYSGSNCLGDVAWYYENSGVRRLDDSKWDYNELEKNHSCTHTVGSKAPNELGLYDMSGNVYEWCLDDYVEDSSKAVAEFTRGDDQSSAFRVMRDGGWFGNAGDCRSAYRSCDSPDGSNISRGFRLALASEAQAKREAEEKAKREAEEKAKREAEEKAKREAEEKAKREAEEKAKREAEELASLERHTVQLPNGVTLEMVKVEAGTFTMSKKDGDNYFCEVEHTATLTNDFYIGKTEVTLAQWKAVMGNNPSWFKGDSLPVEGVNWYAAMDFCKKLNELTEGKRPAGYHYTLPTETQWEFACRGGNRSKGYKYSGSSNIDDVAWYGDNSGDKIHEVGTKQANELGLYDMSGNVYEWCLDDYKGNSSKAVAEFIRGEDKSRVYRVKRGGSWRSSAEFCRPAYRHDYSPNDGFCELGFRLALAAGEYSYRQTQPKSVKQEAEAQAKREAEERAKREAEEKAGLERHTVQLPNGVTLEMVKVEAGTFTMSKRDGENWRGFEVEHTATLTKDFYIGKTEVTQAQWNAVMGNNPSDNKGDNLPVESVLWHEVMEFCKKLNELTEGKRPAGYHYTLPTETQWEFACRGGKRSKGYKYSGSNDINTVAWYDGNSENETHEVGGKAPNELGLYDMSGNVYEWCLDDWHGKSNEAVAEFTRGDVDRNDYMNDWNRNKITYRVLRSGSWNFEARRCRSVSRDIESTVAASAYLGFRLALAPERY